MYGFYIFVVVVWFFNFDLNEKFEDLRRYGVLEFELMVKVGGLWECELIVLDNI